ncbi:hypothetical protein [Psychroserpens sp. NJDZ02]|uniref:hypothetical protein n=1 Tax=Psychroserpens sp. NJDZ02 TaxID=2570561 RepID=UPI0010A7C067|nr:hypothetical protein [Psychroserpens sp. NJDZ02]QCE40404.1 hypothetical protein E9099_02900 [Psychroserpens sp. NJDZ02]
MKNLKKLGKTLTKAEQKTINGGRLSYSGNGCTTDPTTSNPHPLSAYCECLASGRNWNEECNRCEIPNVYYISDGNCGS